MTWTAKTAQLESQSLSERSKSLPDHLQKILSLGEDKAGLNRVWLFGSRVKGPARENSDFDLAFDVRDQSGWSDFVTSVHDDPPSLYKYDLVNISDIDENFRSVILKEGLLIYGRG